MDRPKAYPTSGELTSFHLRNIKWKETSGMLKFLVWCILLVICWPLALIALLLYPIVWLLLLPFRIVGIAVGSALAAVWLVVMLPARILREIV
jgi:hypothetical protein